MALNLDDLIGSMQQVHAGDRGQGLEEIRENLRATLGQQALGPSYGQHNPHAGPSSSRQVSGSGNGNGGASGGKRGTSTPQYRNGSSGGAPGQDGAGGQAWVGGSSLVDDTPMPPPGSYQDASMGEGQDELGMLRGHAAGGGGGAPRSFASNGSWGQASNGSYQSGAGSSGFGFAQAPANTPLDGGGGMMGGFGQQQQQFQQHFQQQVEQDGRGRASFSPNHNQQQQQAAYGAQGDGGGGSAWHGSGGAGGNGNSSPKKLVSGFEPSPIR